MEHTTHTIIVKSSVDHAWSLATQLRTLPDWFPSVKAVDGDVRLGDEEGVRYTVQLARLLRVEVETLEVRPLVAHRRAFHAPSWNINGELMMTFAPGEGGTVVTFRADYDFDAPLIGWALRAVYSARIERLISQAASSFRHLVEAKHDAAHRAAIRDTHLVPSVRAA
jgi:hypothetical protein